MTHFLLDDLILAWWPFACLPVSDHVIYFDYSDDKTWKLLF